MILKNLGRTGWVALISAATATACSKRPATEEAFVVASFGNDPGLCPVSDANVISVGTVNMGPPSDTSIEEPTTVPDGSNGLSVDCSVSANGDGYNIQLNASVPGSSGGNLIITGHVTAGQADGTGGGTVRGQFVSESASAAFGSTDCTVTYLYGSLNGTGGQVIPMSQRIAAGSIFAHISCPNAVQPGNGSTGLQVTGPDGGVVNATCDAEADFLFQNCND